MGNTSPLPEVRVCAHAAALARQVAQLWAALASQCVAQQGRFSVALAGGNTPKAAYALLATHPYHETLPWQQTHVFWGDERYVPADHPRSNYRMAYETLLAHVDIPASNVHRILTEREPEEAATAYEQTLRTFFALPEGTWPRFDLLLLGMGADGHTASLFPGNAALHERRRLVVAPWVEQVQAFRITLTPPVLCHARHVVFVVSGREKAHTLHQVLRGPYQPERYPAQLIRPVQGTLLWLVDKAAATLLA